MELCSCASQDGRRVWGRMNTCICMAESLCCSPETTTMLLIRYFVVQSLSRVQLFVTPSKAALQASLSFTISWNLLTFTCIESVMPSHHLILCHPLLLPSTFPTIRVLSNESILHIRWPKYWNFSFSISPSNEYSGLISFRIN